MKKKAISAILAASLVFAMTACSGDEKTDETSAAQTEAQTEATEAETTAPETEAAQTEAQETEAAVEEGIRVASLSPEVTEIIFALGAQDKLVGVSTYDDYPADVFDYPQVGDLYALNVEAIVAVEPTVVIASSFMDEDTIAALNEYGIEVASVMEGTSVDGVYSLINEVAVIVDAEDAAAELIDEIQADLDAIETVDSDATVYYVVSYGEYGDWSAGAGSFIDSIITTAGAVNAAGELDMWASLDTETLIAMDPDFIVIASWSYDDFITLEPYASLTAVQEGRVISVDPNLFERQTPRNVEAVEIIAQAVAEYEAA